MRPSLGFALDTATDDIVTVKAAGIADRGGLLAGDTILEMDGMSPMAFLAGEWWPRDDKPILVKVRRDERIVWRVLAFGDVPVLAPKRAAPEAGDGIAGMFGATPPPVSAPPADPFRGLFSRPAVKPAVLTQLAGISPGHEHIVDSPLFPRRPADRRAVEASLRAAMERPNRNPAPPMGNMGRWNWTD